MDERDIELRNRTYARFVELGRAPAASELGNPDEVVSGWRRLHDAHALVLNPATDELRMANPFSAIPTRRCATPPCSRSVSWARSTRSTWWPPDSATASRSAARPPP